MRKMPLSRTTKGTSRRTRMDKKTVVVKQLRADAFRNREHILKAARDSFALHGPQVPLEEIARQAGVGIGTLYRRFPHRQALQRAVALDVLERSAHEARLALREEPDAFHALARYMHRALDLRAGAVMPQLAGELPMEDREMRRAQEAATAPIQAMIDAAQANGTLRPDVAFGDISVLIIRLARPLPAPFSRDLNDRLAHRHLDLVIAGLRTDDAHPVSLIEGPALTFAELRELDLMSESTPAIDSAPNDDPVSGSNSSDSTRQN